MIFAPDDELHNSLSTSIINLYAEIDALEKGEFPNAEAGTYGIYILYDNTYHYPRLVFYNSQTGHYYMLEIEKFVVDPDIPNEDSAQNPYPY